MELHQKRRWYTSKSTISELFVDESEVRQCYILEDPARPDGVKIYGETCIPCGRYEIKITYSDKFKRQMPELIQVPMFKYIRIHWGNDPEDTLGCLLTGTYKKKDWVGKSQDAYDALFYRLSQAIKVRKERVFINIVDAPEDDYFQNSPAFDPDPRETAGN